LVSSSIGSPLAAAVVAAPAAVVAAPPAVVAVDPAVVSVEAAVVAVEAAVVSLLPLSSPPQAAATSVSATSPAAIDVILFME